CLWGLYWLLRELRVSRQGALLGTATLGVNPIFFMLSFTFMTDVPFLALMVWASFAMVRAVCTKRTGWLLAATILAGLTVAVPVDRTACRYRSPAGAKISGCEQRSAPLSSGSSCLPSP